LLGMCTRGPPPSDQLKLCSVLCVQLTSEFGLSWNIVPGSSSNIAHGLCRRDCLLCRLDADPQFHAATSSLRTTYVRHFRALRYKEFNDSLVVHVQLLDNRLESGCSEVFCF